MINVTLKGGAVKEFEPGVSPADVAKSIGMGLYKSACAARVDGEAVDLRTPLEKDCELEILTFDSPEGKHAFWHTGAHIMAQASSTCSRMPSSASARRWTTAGITTSAARSPLRRTSSRPSRLR